MSTASRFRDERTVSSPAGVRKHGLVDAPALEALDETIHQKARLGIMSTLLALGEADFRLLKETLGLTDGNLSTHLALLEERGYVAVTKEFRGRKPHTSARPTERGRIAFREYLAALERIIQAAQSAESTATG